MYIVQYSPLCNISRQYDTIQYCYILYFVCVAKKKSFCHKEILFCHNIVQNRLTHFLKLFLDIFYLFVSIFPHQASGPATTTTTKSLFVLFHMNVLPFKVNGYWMLWMSRTTSPYRMSAERFLYSGRGLWKLRVHYLHYVALFGANAFCCMDRHLMVIGSRVCESDFWQIWDVQNTKSTQSFWKFSKCLRKCIFTNCYCPFQAWQQLLPTPPPLTWNCCSNMDMQWIVHLLSNLHLI